MAQLGSSSIYGDLDLKNNSIKQVKLINDITDTELSCLDGVNSNVQTQLDSKAPKENIVTLGTVQPTVGWWYEVIG